MLDTCSLASDHNSRRSKTKKERLQLLWRRRRWWYFACLEASQCPPGEHAHRAGMARKTSSFLVTSGADSAKCGTFTFRRQCQCFLIIWKVLSMVECPCAKSCLLQHLESLFLCFATLEFWVVIMRTGNSCCALRGVPVLMWCKRRQLSSGYKDTCMWHSC